MASHWVISGIKQSPEGFTVSESLLVRGITGLHFSPGVHQCDRILRRLDTGIFLTDASGPVMLLGHEMLTDLPENCKEAPRQICFNLFLQILYNFQQGDQ